LEFDYFRVYRPWSGWPVGPAAERSHLREEIVVEKERDTKEDGRYIIYYWFELDDGEEA
jgi:hypothetical protein